MALNIDDPDNFGIFIFRAKWCLVRRGSITLGDECLIQKGKTASISQDRIMSAACYITDAFRHRITTYMLIV